MSRLALVSTATTTAHLEFYCWARGQLWIPLSNQFLIVIKLHTTRAAEALVITSCIVCEVQLILYIILSQLNWASLVSGFRMCTQLRHLKLMIQTHPHIGITNFQLNPCITGGDDLNYYKLHICDIERVANFWKGRFFDQLALDSNSKCQGHKLQK